MRKRAKGCAVVCSAAALLVPLARAADRYYVGPANGSWNDPNNWSAASGGAGGAGTPAPGDNAFLLDVTKTPVNFDATYDASPIGQVTIDGSGGQISLLQDGSTSSMHSLSQLIGLNGSGRYEQSAGTNTIDTADEFLALGQNAGSSGVYDMSGGTLSITSTRFIGGLIVGTSGQGTFNLSGGVVNVMAGLGVGAAGAGTFEQTGGVVTVGSESAGYGLFLGNFSGSRGMYHLTTGGTLTISADLQVGFNGSGTFVQDGGLVSVGSTTTKAGNVILANSTSASGAYTINAGTLSTHSIIVGGDPSSAGGSATLTVNGGVVNAGFAVEPNGVVNLNGGTVNAGSDPLADNILNNGTINNNGGVLNLGGRIYGSGTIISASGTISLAGGTALDGGEFAMLGGTGSSSGSVVLAKSAAASLNLSGGSLTINGVLGVGNAGTLTSGAGAGQVTVSGGTLTASTMLVGSTTGGSGQLAISNTGHVVIGGGLAAGDLRISGGTLEVLDQSPPPGEDPLLSRSILTGYLGNGSISISGGAVITPGLAVGVTSGNVGLATQSAGSVTITDLLQIGSGAGSSGAYSISGGTLNLSTNDANTVFYGPLLVGANGSGTLNVSGNAVVNTSGNSEVGLSSGASGVVNQTGGHFTAGVPGTSSVGLFVGRSTGSTGVYNIDSSTGTSTLDVYGNLYVGESGIGTINQNGGSVTVHQDTLGNGGYLQLADSGGTGRYNIANGTLTAREIDVGGYAGGPGGPGSLTINAGATVNVNGTYVWNWQGTGNISVNGGALNVGTLLQQSFLQQFGTLTVNSGTVTSGFQIATFGKTVQNGGLVAIQNPAGVLWMFEGGSYTINAGTIAVPGLDVGGLTAPDGAGSLTINGGHVDVSSVVEIESTGTVDLNAGSLTTFNLTNSGHLNVGGGTYSVSGVVQGAGIVSQTAGVAAFANQTNLNTGTIQVSGGIATADGTLLVGNSVQNSIGNGNLVIGGGTTSAGVLAVGNAGTLATGSGAGHVMVSGGLLSVDTVLLGSTSGGSGQLVVSNNGHVVIGGGIAANDLTISGGTLEVLDQSPPAGEDPTLNRAIVAGYLTDGSVRIGGGAVSAPVLKLGVSSGNTGTVTQTGGTVNVGVLGVGNDATTIGGAGAGRLDVQGGTLSVGTSLLVGSTAGASGSVTISAGTITDAGLFVTHGTVAQSGGSIASSSADVGYGAAGSFIQTGGTHTIATDLDLARLAGSTGTYSISSGTLNIAMGLNVANVGDGSFVQQGGIVTAQSLGIGALGSNPGENGNGTYVLSDGTLNVAVIENVGVVTSTGAGRGTFNQSGGTHLINNEQLIIGKNGTYNLSNGTLVTAGAVPELVCDGLFHQTGGAASIGGDLRLGQTAGHAGTYLLDAGSLTFHVEYVGEFGTGTFVQIGGIHTCADGNLNIAVGTGSSGVYRLNGGTLAVQGDIVIGPGGSITEAPGANLILDGTIRSPANVSADGSGVIQTSGTFSIADGTSFNGVLFNGQSGSGSTTGTILFGNQAGVSTLNISGATAVVNGLLAVGNAGTLASGGGTSQLLVSAGTLTANTLLVGSSAGGKGAMTVSGTGHVVIGGGAAITNLSVSGGTLEVLDQPPPSGEDPTLNRAIVAGYLTDGSVSISGGAVTAPVLKLGVSSGNTGALNLSGGSVNVGTLAVAGDTSTGSGDVLVTNTTLTADTTLVGSAAGGTGSVTVGDGGILSTQNATLTNGTFLVGSGGLFQTNSLVVYGGHNEVQSNGTLSVGAAGLDFLGASPSLSFDTHLNLPGTLQLRGDVSLTSTSSTASISSNGIPPLHGTLDLGAGMRTFTISSAATLAISTRIIDGGIVKSGPGTLRLITSNSYQGGTVLSNGTLEVDDPGALGTGPVLFQGGALALKTGSPSSSLTVPLTTAPGNSIVLDVGSETGLFQIPGGTLGSQVTVNGNAGGMVSFTSAVMLQNSVNFVANTPLMMSAPISQLNGTTLGLTKSGTSVLTFAAPQSNNYTGVTTVNAGTLVLAGGAGGAVRGDLQVNSDGAVKLLSPQQINQTTAVFVNGGTLDLGAQNQTVASLSNSGTVSIGASSTLKVIGAFTNTGTVQISGAAIFDYSAASPIGVLKNELVTGYSGGRWTGGGIDSSAAAAVEADQNNHHKTAIAYADSSALAFGELFGQPIDSPGVVLLYTYAGDADLNGRVDAADFTRMAQHFGSSSAIWTDGDFNYDSRVNALDFNAIAENFGQSMQSASAVASLVPEPAMVTGLAATLLMIRRRRAEGRRRSL